MKPSPIVRLLTLALPSTVTFFFTVAFSFTIASLVTFMFPVTDISFWTVINPLIFALPFTSSSALGSSFLVAIPTNPSAVTHNPGCDLEPIFQRSEPYTIPIPYPVPILEKIPSLLIIKVSCTL